MKESEDILKEALGEIRYSLNGEITNSQLKWAMEEYSNLKGVELLQEMVKVMESKGMFSTTDIVSAYNNGLETGISILQSKIDSLKK
jgi:hypothetical protein